VGLNTALELVLNVSFPETVLSSYVPDDALYFTNALNTFEPLRQGTSDTIRYTKTLIDDLFNQSPDSMVSDGGLTAED